MKFVSDLNNGLTEEQVAINRETHGVNKLEEKERDILQRKFGMSGYEPQTLEEIGKIYNLTKERIRQILAKSLFKIERKLVKSINKRRHYYGKKKSYHSRRISKTTL